MNRSINKQNQICKPHFFNKVAFSVTFYMHEWLYVAVSLIYGSRIHSLNMVKNKNVSNSDICKIIVYCKTLWLVEEIANFRFPLLKLINEIYYVVLPTWALKQVSWHYFIIQYSLLSWAQMFISLLTFSWERACVMSVPV